MKNQNNFQVDFKEIDTKFKDVNHMINVTYKFVKDPKLLLTIIKKLFEVSLIIVDLILKDNYKRKNISVIPKTESAKIALFDSKISPLYDFGDELVEILKKLNNYISLENNSIIVSKDNKVIFYITNYTTSVFSIDDANNIYKRLLEIYRELKKEHELNGI